MWVWLIKKDFKRIWHRTHSETDFSTLTSSLKGALFWTSNVQHPATSNGFSCIWTFSLSPSCKRLNVKNHNHKKALLKARMFGQWSGSTHQFEFSLYFQLEFSLIKISLSCVQFWFHFNFLLHRAHTPRFTGFDLSYSSSINTQAGPAIFQIARLANGSRKRKLKKTVIKDTVVLIKFSLTLFLTFVLKLAAQQVPLLASPHHTLALNVRWKFEPYHELSSCMNHAIEVYCTAVYTYWTLKLEHFLNQKRTRKTTKGLEDV